MLLGAAQPVFGSLAKVHSGLLLPFGRNVQESRSTTDKKITIGLTELKTDKPLGDAEGKIYPTSNQFPNNVTIAAPENLKPMLGAFSTRQKIIIGPKDWTGDEKIGTNGNIVISLYPKGGSTEKGSRISVYEIPGCWSCALDATIPYFEPARNEAKQYSPKMFDPNKTPQGMKYKLLSPNIAEYTLPDTADGLQIKGVVYTKIVKDKITTPVLTMEVILPAKDMKLGEFLLKNYLSRETTENLVKNIF